MKAEDLFAGKGSVAQQLGGAGWDTTQMQPTIDPGYNAKELISEGQQIQNKPVNPKMIALGALNQAGFGIPGAVANLFDPKGVEFAKQDASFQAGEGLGSFISSALPVTKLAGLGLKGIEALAGGSKIGQAVGKVGSGLEKLGSVNKGLAQGGRTASDAMLGQLIKNTAANEDPGEGFNKFIMSGVSGLGTGLATGALSRIGKGIEELGEKANAATLGLAAGNTISRRDVKRLFGDTDKKVSIGDPDKAIKEMADWVKKDNPLGKDLTASIDRPENFQAIYNVTKQNLSKYDPIFQDNPEIINKPLLDDIAKAVPGIKKEFSGIVDKEIVNKTDDIAQDILEDLSSRDYMGKINKLNDIMNSTKGATFGKDFSGPEAIRYKVASELKKSMDNAVDKYAESVGDTGLKEWRKHWGMLVKMKPFIMRDVMSDFKDTGFGSGTAEKTIASQLTGDNIGESAGGIVKSWAGALAKKAGELGGRKILAGTKGLAEFLQDSPVAQKVINAVQQGAEKGGPLVAREAANYLQNKDQIDQGLQALSTGEVSEAANDPVVAGHVAGQAAQEQKEGAQDKYSPAYMQNVQQKMMDFWDNSKMGSPLLYGPASMDNPAFIQWAQGVKEQTGFAPEKIAKILFPNNIDKEKFKAVYGAAKAINENLGLASKYAPSKISEALAGVPVLGPLAESIDKPKKDTEIAYQTLRGALGDLAKKSGIDQKQFDSIFTGIMRQGNPAQKQQALQQLIQKLNPEGFALHKQAGLL